MTHLWRLFSAFRAAHGARLALGATLAILATLMGAALLGLSGWFVAGAALSGAGLAVKASSLTGASWVLRILALGRTTSRYGERLATHDATLRFLSDVRGRLYRGLAEGPWRMLGRLRRGEALSRLTADVDALDGFYLRLLLPIATASIALTIGFAALWRFAGPTVAFATLAPLAVAGGLCLKLGVRRGGRDPARRGTHRDCKGTRRSQRRARRPVRHSSCRGPARDNRVGSGVFPGQAGRARPPGGRRGVVM